MLDSSRYFPDDGPPILVRDIPTHMIEEHIAAGGVDIIENSLGEVDPVFWVMLRLEVELIRRRLGIAIL
jgi:hypothetical protein